VIRIEASTLYTRADLAGLLAESGVDVDHFIGRLKPKKRFRMLFWGQDLLEALAAAPVLGESEDRADPLPAIPGKRRGRPPRKQSAIPGAKGLISGFTPEEIGLR
jgi:hypothetical protein